MANIIKLGNRPKTFKEMNVPVTLPNGDQGVIPVTFKYFPKEEFGAWQDKAMAKGKAAAQKESQGGAEEQEKEFSWESIYRQSSELLIENLLDVIASWGLEEALSRQSLQQLEHECGAAVLPAMLESFTRACREGRLGN